MSASGAFNAFVSEAMSLPKAQRSELADKLIASLDEDFTVSSSWMDEINRRAKEIDQGLVQTIPHEEVMRRAHELVAKNRRK